MALFKQSFNQQTLMTMKTRLTSLLALIMIGGYSIASAQGYDDDDIYYNPSKAKKSAPVKKTADVVVADFPAADTYTPATTGVNIDVDTYNRRGTFANDTVTARSENQTNFECTQQIERFYNPRVVIESPDESLAQLYYAEPTADVNIIINTPGYWGFGYSPYYYNSPWYWGTPRSWWYYNSWAYNPWYWGYGPSWSWGWGPSWAWGPAWGPSWGWGGYYPPHRPAWANRPSGNVRPGYRPGNNAYGNARPAASGNYRPGNNSGYRPGTGGNNSGYRTGRGTNRSNSSNGYRPGNNYNNSNSNYRPGNNSNRSQSSPSYRSGSSRSSGSYGGYRGGSSGGSRSGGATGRGRH